MDVFEGEGVELFKEQAKPVKAIFSHEGRWAQGALLDPLSWEQGVVGAALMAPAFAAAVGVRALGF